VQLFWFLQATNIILGTNAELVRQGYRLVMAIWDTPEIHAKKYAHSEL
jgi:hypothetical protein